MADEKYTKEGLPIVRREIVDVLLRDIIRRGDEGKESLKKLVEDLVNSAEAENPAFDEFITRFGVSVGKSGVVKSYEELELYMRKVMMGFYCCYELLRRQVRANQLEEESKK